MRCETLILGAGFGGIGAAIRMKQSGLDDFLILERAGDVGGTWRDNTYPGAACDVPSNLYSFSFAKNPDWSRAYSRSAEIQGYVQRIVDEHGLRPRIHFHQEVCAMRFDEPAGEWEVRTKSGSVFRARSVISAMGGLTNPSLPAIDGIECFAGKTIHSARWDHGYDFAGKRVAVIGTGASAVQIIPELVKVAGHVKVFQRTPGWVVPRPDRRVPERTKTLFRRAPAAQQAVRDALFWGHESTALAVIWTSPLTRVAEGIARRFGLSPAQSQPQHFTCA